MIGAAHLLLAVCLSAGVDSAPPQRLKILILGDRGHHQPARRAGQLLVPLAARGIDLFYSERLADLNETRLAYYDGLLLYANHLEISPAQRRALLDFVEQGKGFLPIHCASACFPSWPAYARLVGARFKSHNAGVFESRITAPDHPLMAGLGPHRSWDETYLHQQHNQAGRTVLSVRQEGDLSEPWTWVREQGRGRVFYSAWGHDERTWSQAWFQTLLERGIRWSCGDDAPGRTAPRPPFRYTQAEVPDYQPGRQGRLEQMQLPLTPDESLARLVVPPEFEVRLFASEPEIKKPIAMAFDQRGRLWIAETVDYPNNLRPPGAGRDSIRICEDTDGDGRADKFTLFADRLSIPTSIVFADGGLIVSQAPDMLLLRDTDGDDREDQRRVLFSGFGTFDTHAGPSNLRYGFDNWIWGTVGYSGFEGTVGGEQHSFRQGLFRFRPDGSKLEFLASTTNNTWGLGFSEEGFVFGSTANGNPSVYLPIPNRYFEAVEGLAAGALPTIAESLRFHPITDNVRQVDWHGQFTAGAGHADHPRRESAGRDRPGAAVTLAANDSGRPTRGGGGAESTGGLEPGPADRGPEGAGWRVCPERTALGAVRAPPGPGDRRAGGCGPESSR